MERHHEESSPTLLILAQVDHACGDVIASVIERLCGLGVQNVHLVPSLTKKGRPGYLLFIDLPESLLDDVKRMLAIELGVLGLRVLRDEHHAMPFERTERPVRIAFGDYEEKVDVPVKLITTPQGLMPVGVEHDFCVRLQRQLREEHGVEVPLHVLKSSILAAVCVALEESRDGMAANDSSINR